MPHPMKTTCLSLLMISCLLAASAAAREYHVATAGDDASGAADAPLRTIQQAANRTMPGDVITVHEGVYRERIDPPRGGESNKKRITYQAAPGAISSPCAETTSRTASRRASSAASARRSA